MDTLNFKTNWNGKLDCNFYTSIRIWNEGKYVVGKCFEVLEKKQKRHISELVKAVPFTLDKLPEITAYLDTGYSLSETKDIIAKMYPNYNGLFGLYLFKVVEKYEPGNAGEQPEKGTHLNGSLDVNGGAAMPVLPLHRISNESAIICELAKIVAKCYVHLFLSEGNKTDKHKATNSTIYNVICKINPLAKNHILAIFATIEGVRFQVAKTDNLATLFN